MFFPRSLDLLIQTSVVTTVTTGDAKKVRTLGGDDQGNNEQRFAVAFDVTIAGGSSPTADAKLETSWDNGVTWFPVATMTQLVGAGTKKQLVEVAHLGPKVRAVLTPGGSTAGNTTAKIRLISTGGLEVLP